MYIPHGFDLLNLMLDMKYNSFKKKVIVEANLIGEQAYLRLSKIIPVLFVCWKQVNVI